MTDTANTTTETAPINYAKPTVFKIGGKWAAGLGYEVLRTRTKAEAEAHITVADALCCGVRAAVQERYSYLDFAMMSAADDLGYAARKLRDELARIQRDATDDITRMAAGCNLWAAGNFGRRGADVDAYHAEWKAAWKHYSTLAGVVRHAEPTGYAAIGLAIAGFISGQAVR